MAFAAEPTLSTARDFDFWMGRWKVHNRRLRAPLTGSDEWDEFEATSVAHPILGGLGNEDEFRTRHAGGFVGMSFRFFDPATRRWSIYWADSRRPIKVRFIWSGTRTRTPRWEQAFSADDGETWETNWIMDFSPAGAQ